MQRSVESLLFYYPAAWWVFGVIRLERENCCDDVAVSVSGNVHEYAAVLTALEHNRCSGCEAAVASAGGSLVKRIRRLLCPQRVHGVWTPLLASVILITTTVVALAAWPAEPSQQSSATTQRQTSRAEIPRHDKWLNQDVVYIINDEERTAFQKLTSDEERDKFVGQFWDRRNPNPGSGKNKFKEEHYRRIAHANAHFATSGPGWLTDRGHMYIVYGPPDEIEDHPKGEGSTYAREIWMYHHVDGVGDRVFLTFMDWTGKGDYHLSPGNAR
jgi:GWxTD domain-containing protein